MVGPGKSPFARTALVRELAWVIECVANDVRAIETYNIRVRFVGAYVHKRLTIGGHKCVCDVLGFGL
jgi:hypothetical protein